MSETAKTRVALLVDGDNIGSRHAARLLALAGQHGMISVARIYTDARGGSDWHGAIGYRLIHAGTGKNAADLLLCIDAVELALSGRFDHFVIASSDGDFTHLAQKLGERGLTVTGAGEAQASARFRAACQGFVVLARPPETAAPKPVAAPAPKPVPKLSALDRQIRAVIAEGGAGIQISALGAKMSARHGTLTSALPEKNWRAYLVARPALYALDPRGPKACVRLQPGAHVASA